MGNKRYIIICVSVIIAIILFVLARNMCVTGKFVADDLPNINSFVECLNENGVYVYSFGEGNQQVDFQLNMFGDLAQNISIINCADSPGQCIGVVVYPSWNIDGRIVSGGLSLGVLSQFSGCRL